MVMASRYHVRCCSGLTQVNSGTITDAPQAKTAISAAFTASSAAYFAGL
jgi:hypothetical protein